MSDNTEIINNSDDVAPDNLINLNESALGDTNDDTPGNNLNQLAPISTTDIASICGISQQSMQSFCKFLLQLREIKGVSAQNCDAIVNKFNEMCLECIDNTKSSLDKLLHISDDETFKVLSPLYAMESSLHAMNLTYKRELHETFSYVAPVLIKLPNDTCVTYVPILKQLSQLLHHEDVLAEVIDRPDTELIREFSDGSDFKLNAFFQNNSLQVKLYIDDFQIINPLSNKVKQHKICAIYWQIRQLAT